MNAFQPKISVIITCFNYQHYVGLAIESALAQTYQNVEIIVIDDGSTDGSAETISHYSDRIQSIRQANEGHISAYNCGYRESIGDIIIFLDADDLLMSTAAEKVASVWHKAAAKVQYDLTIIDAMGNPLGRRFCNFQAGYDANHIRKKFKKYGTYRWPVTSGNAYSRWFLEKIMPLKEKLGPDGMLNTMAPLYGDVLCLQSPLGSYRLHGQNIWASTGSDFSRLPQRIEYRQREVEIMREHAKIMNIDVPHENVLDYEIAFINYRLMALKMGLSYNGSVADSALRLWWSGVRLQFIEYLPIQMKIAHFVWLSVLASAPRFAARKLIAIRFNRAEYAQSAGRFLRSFSQRLSGCFLGL